jgi:aerobic carbon-monoxide dehydrogenase medium subunit
MKPPAFAYAAPRSLEEALRLKAEHGDEAKFLAGGQSLVPAMNFRLAAPAMLIDLNGIAELDFIRAAPDSVGPELRLGAMVRQRRLERDRDVAALSPLLHEAMPVIAHPQIRNRGTLGGSLAHADPAAELPVIVLALDGRLRAQSATGERWIAAADFFQGLFTTALAPDELLAEVALPAQPPGTGTAFLEFARRRGDYAIMGVAAVITLDDAGLVQAARLVFLNAGEGPMSAASAAGLLVGQAPGAELFEAVAAAAAADEIEPMGNVHGTPEYQRHLARVLARRALEQALARAGHPNTLSRPA